MKQLAAIATPVLPRPHRASATKASAIAACCVAAACVVPFALSGFQTFQVTMVLIYAIALIGYNILTGYNGQLSLGHGAFFAVGAYTAAILLDRNVMPYWATIPVAAVVSFAVGFLFGFPALRLSGLYLAITTFALATATPQLLKFHLFEKWTGGVAGVVVMKPEAPAGIPLTADQWMYFFCLGVALVMLFIAWNLINGRVGRAIVAIRDNPVAAESMGIDVALYKTVTFGISAMFTGVAGALSALVSQFVSPDSFTAFFSFSLLVGSVVGGVTSIFGAIFGAIFIQFIPNIAGDISKAAPWAIYGAFLIAFMYVLPGGVMEGLKRLAARRGHR